MERLLTIRKRLLVMALHGFYWSPGNKELGEQSCGKRKGFYTLSDSESLPL